MSSNCPLLVVFHAVARTAYETDHVCLSVSSFATGIGNLHDWDHWNTLLRNRWNAGHFWNTLLPNSGLGSQCKNDPRRNSHSASLGKNDLCGVAETACVLQTARFSNPVLNSRMQFQLLFVTTGLFTFVYCMQGDLDRNVTTERSVDFKSTGFSKHI